MSFEDRLTTGSAEADASGASGSIEDTRNWLKKAGNMSERKRKCSRRKGEKSSPSRPQEEPDKLGSETAAPDNVHSVRECYRSHQHNYIKAENSP